MEQGVERATFGSMKMERGERDVRADNEDDSRSDFEFTTQFKVANGVTVWMQIITKVYASDEADGEARVHSESSCATGASGDRVPEVESPSKRRASIKGPFQVYKREPSAI